jgi:hypothetical protein
MKLRQTLILALLTFVMGACAAPTQPPPLRRHGLQPVALVDTVPDHELQIKLGFYNAGPEPYPAVENLGAGWTLEAAPDEARTGGRVHMLGEIAPSSEVYPVIWNGQLDPGAYRLTWGAPDIGSTVVAFEVFEEAGGYRIGDVRQWVGTEYSAPAEVQLP